VEFIENSLGLFTQGLSVEGAGEVDDGGGMVVLIGDRVTLTVHIPLWLVTGGEVREVVVVGAGVSLNVHHLLANILIRRHSSVFLIVRSHALGIRLESMALHTQALDRLHKGITVDLATGVVQLDPHSLPGSGLTSIALRLRGA
jgi:hypothetical protein